MGARKVYAVEASNMHANARKLISSIGLAHIIEVVHSRVEEADISEKVDVMISEPMGNLLVSERMLESYVAARDRFLKPGGLMLPGKSNIFAAPYSDAVLHVEPWTKAAFWQNGEFHGEDLSGMHEEAVNSFFRTPVIDALNAAHMLAQPVSVELDFHTITKEQLQTIQMPMDFVCTGIGVVHGIACWFDVTFDAPHGMVEAGFEPIRLTTAPGAPLTHWWQTCLLLKQPLGVNVGQELTGLLDMRAHKMQSYNLELTVQLKNTAVPASSETYDLKNPLYRCANHHGLAIPTNTPVLEVVYEAQENAKSGAKSQDDGTGRKRRRKGKGRNVPAQDMLVEDLEVGINLGAENDMKRSRT